jgi:hypothetical protein
MVLVVIRLGDGDGGIQVVVGQGRIQDFVAVVLQVGRLQSAGRRFPVVEEEDFHEEIVALIVGRRV